MLADSTALVSFWSYNDFTSLKFLIPTTFALFISSTNSSYKIKSYHVSDKKRKFLLMDDATSMSLAGSRMALTHSLTHSILINLVNLILPPLLSIVFVQESSVIFRKVFDEGRLERRTFLPEKWRAWVGSCQAHQIIKSTTLVL